MVAGSRMRFTRRIPRETMGTDQFFNVVDDSYKFGGNAELQKVAEDELRETEASRTLALQQMRERIEKHPDIKKCRTDSAFLLRFLRTKKFSVPLAFEMLERYLMIRQLYPNWFRGLDVDDPVVNEILDTGYIFPLPSRDEEGRMVILNCVGKFDPYKYTAADMARVHSTVVEYLMDDEENQIRGYSYINDESGLQMGHISLWSLNELRCMLKCIQNSTPMRHKVTHFINLPAFANKIFDMLMNLLSDKLKARIKLHATVDDMKDHLGTKILPKEYGGEVPMADMIADFKKKLQEKRLNIASLEEMEIDVTNRKKVLPDLEDELTGVAGSFRKLQVD